MNPTPKKPFIQTFGTATVQVVRSKSTGERAAEIKRPGVTTQLVPMDICGLGAGKDAWMRGILFKCDDCGVRFPASEMSGDFCESCSTKDIEE